jgi:hypothetical protein
MPSVAGLAGNTSLAEPTFALSGLRPMCYSGSICRMGFERSLMPYGLPLVYFLVVREQSLIARMTCD